MAVQFTHDTQELKWLLPLVEDMENISPEEQGLLVEAIAFIRTPEALACLEGLREKRAVNADFQTRLAVYINNLRQASRDHGTD